ncbi:MAG: DUF929 family protein [Candidatus Micrarchaeota archaeon]|nr:DUF929 family protein [Candidatus Micrarchaeota archaeon]
MKKTYLYLAVVLVIVGVVLVLVEFGAPNANAQLVQYNNRPVPQSVVSQLTVPVSVSNAIGIGSDTVSGLQKKNNSVMYVNGKPAVIYIGAEYCPFCATTRWGLIIALMRFGTFGNLHYMTSNASDVYPNTPTFTFVNSTYSSSYISFVSVETESYSKQPLQTLNASEQNLVAKYNPVGSIPFIVFANESVQVGSIASPGVLQGRNWNGTIANLTNSSSGVAQAIVGNADIYTAQICKMTNFTPADVCNQSYVKQIASQLG